MKKMKVSLLVAFLLTMVGALVMGGATVAWFTSEAKNTGNSFAAGTLEISLDKPEAEKYFEVDNVQPGDDGSATVTVINTGSLPLRYAFNLTKEGVLFDGKYPLNVRIESEASKMVVAPGNDYVLKRGEKETFAIKWEMPTDAGNGYQGQSGTLGIEVHAEQVDAP